jgi:hypothetical protein
MSRSLVSEGQHQFGLPKGLVKKIIVSNYEHNITAKRNNRV